MTYLRHTEHIIAARQSRTMLANAAASTNARAKATRDAGLVRFAIFAAIVGAALGAVAGFVF